MSYQDYTSTVFEKHSYIYDQLRIQNVFILAKICYAIVTADFGLIQKDGKNFDV